MKNTENEYNIDIVWSYAVSCIGLRSSVYVFVPEREAVLCSDDFPEIDCTVGYVFRNKWNRLLEHLIRSLDELPPSNRRLCLTNSIKGTQIVFFSIDFYSLYILGLGNALEGIS